MTHVNASGVPIRLEVQGPIKPGGEGVMRGLFTPLPEIRAGHVYGIEWKVPRGELSLPGADSQSSVAEDVVYGDELLTGHHVLFLAKDLKADEGFQLTVAAKDNDKHGQKVGSATYN